MLFIRTLIFTLIGPGSILVIIPCLLLSSSVNFPLEAEGLRLLGLVAMRVGKRLSWDAKAMKCTNAPEADKYLKESYRAGWEIPS